MLKYNGSILKLQSNAIVDYVSPPAPSFDEVTIGTQTWKSKNLDIDDGQGGIYTQTVNYGQGDVTEYYYTWAAAVRVANTVNGYHLPSKSEWEALATTIGGSSTAGTKLKSTTGWNSGNGTDDYGFAAYPAGYRFDSSFYRLRSAAEFWTSTELNTSDAYSSFFDTGSVMSMYNQPKRDICCSIRLIKDT